MLGRIGSGSAIAALPLGGLAIAVADDRFLEAWLCLISIAAILLTTFAPWIPLARDLLPSERRIKKLEQLWTNGHELQVGAFVHDEVSWADWQNRQAKWEFDTAQWLARRVSPIEARRFISPVMAHARIGGSFNQDHGVARYRISEQLSLLIRLRDAEKAAQR